MKVKYAVIISLLLSSVMVAPVGATVRHGGGLDSDGGHNCRVGSCAGTYHCHRAWGPGCGGGSSGGGGGNSSGGYSAPALTVASFVNTYGGSFTNSEVARIQKTLKVRGYFTGPINGNYGPQTRSALNRFEKRNQLQLSPGRSIYLISVDRLGVAC